MHTNSYSVFNYGLLHMEWPTALFVLVVFLVLMIALNSFLFKPLIRTLDGRENAVRDYQDKTKNLLQRANELEESLEQQMKSIELVAQQIHGEKRKEAVGEFQQIVSVARKEANDTVFKVETEMAAEVKNASEKSADIIASLGEQITQKLTEKLN